MSSCSKIGVNGKNELSLEGGGCPRSLLKVNKDWYAIIDIGFWLSGGYSKHKTMVKLQLRWHSCQCQVKRTFKVLTKSIPNVIYYRSYCYET